MNAPATHPAALPLRLAGVGKEYRVYDSPRARLKALLTGRALHRSHWALQDVSLELARGQCLGVVGHNGAGKSTLLKLICGTLQPTTGQIGRQRAGGGHIQQFLQAHRSTPVVGQPHQPRHQCR